MAGGYIKLHRRIMDWRWYSDIITRGVFTDLLLRAQYHSQSFQGENLRPGQCVVSYPALSDANGITMRQARTALSHLKMTGEVTVKTTNKYSVITITNWASYQSMEDEATDKVSDKKSSKCPTNVRQKVTIQETKKGKKKEYSTEFESFWAKYPRPVEKYGAFKCWLARIKEGYEPGDMISAATNYAEQRIGQDPIFTKHPSTFLGPNLSFMEYVQKPKPHIDECCLAEIPPDVYAPAPELVAYIEAHNGETEKL